MKRWKRISKPIMAILLVLTMVLTGLPVPVAADEGADTNSPNVVKYLDEEGNEQTAIATEITEEYLEDNNRTLSSGWYVVNDDVTIGSTENTETRESLVISGDVHIILADGCKLTANNGIDVDTENALTIYSQSIGENMGAIYALGNNSGAAIGGSGEGKNCGTVIINGGKIEAYAGDAGIGGGYHGNGGLIMINNGDITARGISGIGGGYEGARGKIIITGGTVKAEGSNAGAGIGGYETTMDSSNIILICGGTVEAKSLGAVCAGAGIGGQNQGICGTIMIFGEDTKVTASSYNDNSGIGNGDNVTTSTGTITGRIMVSDGAELNLPNTDRTAFEANDLFDLGTCTINLKGTDGSVETKNDKHALVVMEQDGMDLSIVEKNTSVSVDINVNSAYTFGGWASSADLGEVDLTSDDISFSMPDETVILVASYLKNLPNMNGKYNESFDDLKTNLADVAEVTQAEDKKITIKLMEDVCGCIPIKISGAYIIFDANGKTIWGKGYDDAILFDHLNYNDASCTVEIIGNGTYKKGNNNSIFIGIQCNLIVKSAALIENLFISGGAGEACLQEGYDYFSITTITGTKIDTTNYTDVYRLGGYKETIAITQHKCVPHAWSEVVSEDTLKSAATCTSPAVYYKTCSVCGFVGESDSDTFTSGTALNHTPNASWEKDADNHWHTCSVSGCGAVIESTKATHTYGSDNKCVTCGYEKSASTSVVTAPSITTQPENASIKVGETAAFAITATGTDLTYQWQIDRNDGNGFVNIANATSTSYTTSTVTKDCDGFKYQCIVSNSAGTVKSNVVTLTVTEQEPATETPASSYTIIEGKDESWTQGTTETVTVRADGDFVKFTGVKVNDTLIDAKNYTAVSGSTVVTLKEEYLKTLEAGTYKLTIEFTDGSCSTNFVVEKAVQENPVPPTEPQNPIVPSEPTEPQNPGTTSPKTGEITGFEALGIFALLGICEVLKKKSCV